MEFRVTSRIIGQIFQGCKNLIGECKSFKGGVGGGGQAIRGVYILVGCVQRFFQVVLTWLHRERETGGGGY